MAEHVKRTQRVTVAVAGPRAPAIGGKLIQAVYTLIVPVPRVPTGVIGVHRAEDHEIRLAAYQGDARNARDGNQAAARASGRARTEVGDSGQVIPKRTRHLSAGKSAVVGPDAGVESVGWNDETHTKI